MYKESWGDTVLVKIAQVPNTNKYFVLGKKNTTVEFESKESKTQH